MRGRKAGVRSIGSKSAHTTGMPSLWNLRARQSTYHAAGIANRSAQISRREIARDRPPVSSE
jgi:hypothetical protein